MTRWFKRYIKKHPKGMLFLSGIFQPLVRCLLNMELALGKLTDLLIRKTRSVFDGNTSSRDRFYLLVARKMHPARLKDEMFREIQHRELPLKASMAGALFTRHYYHADTLLPEWKINDKPAGIRFAMELGIRVPKSYHTDIPFARILPSQATIVKPSRGHSGLGVFIVKTSDAIIELKTGREFSSWSGLKAYVMQDLLEPGILVDSWMVEEFISDGLGNVPVDVKFNAFYGRIGWIAEVQRHPDVRYHIMDGNGKTIDSGLYRKNELFVGKGPDKEEIAVAERISLKIPAPFIRIDFLRGKNGLVFNEFTPRPGVMGYFKETRDNSYGRMFHEAEARLLNDFLSGKRFDAFQKTSRTMLEA